MAKDPNGAGPERDGRAASATRAPEKPPSDQPGSAEFEALFALAAVGISQADALTGRILLGNPKFQQMTGYSLDELRQRTFLDITHPDDRDTNRAEFQRLLNGEVTEMTIEKRYVRKDGSVFVGQVSSSIIRDEAGRPLRAVGIIRDVTAERAAERALRESEQRQRLITETIQDVFWLSTPGVARMIYVSPAYERIWGRTRESLYAEPRSFIEAVHPDDRERLLAGLEEHAQGHWAFEYRILRPDGEVRWIRDRGFAVRGDDGGLCAMTGIASDITELKRALLREEELTLAMRHRSDELERLNRDLEQFTYAAAHDLKAPLRAVDNLASWIEDDLGTSVPPEVRSHLALMHQRINHMRRLLEDLLAYARAGQPSGKIEHVDVAELLARQVAALPIPAAFQVHPPAPGVVLDTSPLLLGQVLANLVANAVQHHDRADGHIWVTVEDADDHLRFQVADDGPGVPPDRRERVFGMFVTFDGQGGTGIGLAMVKKIVERYGGEVALTERSGGGCAVTFTWPKVLQCV